MDHAVAICAQNGEVGDAGLRMDRHVAGSNDVDRGDRLLFLVQRGALPTAVDDDVVGQRFAGGLLRFFRRGQRGRVLRKGGGGQELERQHNYYKE